MQKRFCFITAVSSLAMVREGTYTHHGKEGIQKMKVQTIGNYAELLRREGLLINHISTEKECTKEHRYQIPTSNITAPEKGWVQTRGHHTEAEATWLCQARCWQCVGGTWTCSRLCGLGWTQVLWHGAGRPARPCDVSRTGGVRGRYELYLDK